jgi:DNA-binding response OmpR family regulator
MKEADSKPFQHSILVADDDLLSLEMMSEMLETNGYAVCAVSSSQNVLSSAEKFSPDLFLLDVNMDGIDGYEICERLKQNEKFSNIPVVFLSGLSDSFNKIRGFEVGAVDYINKPLSMQEVMMRIKTHLDLSAKIKDLEEMNAAMMGREMRVIDLKEEVNELSEELGRKHPYPAIWDIKSKSVDVLTE